MMRCTGYPELYHRKSPMGFDLSAKQPGKYKLSTWALSGKEMILEELPNLERNFLFFCGNFGGATDVYRKALDNLEKMSLKECPHTNEWKTLQEKKVPLLLNYTQCKVRLSEYNVVVTRTTSVLKFVQDNDKALFQRAQAHTCQCNLVQAQRDYERVVMLNSPLAGAAEMNLTKLKEATQAYITEQQHWLMRAVTCAGVLFL